MGNTHEVLSTVPDTYVLALVIPVVIPIVTTTKATAPIYNVLRWMLGSSHIILSIPSITV